MAFGSSAFGFFTSSSSGSTLPITTGASFIPQAGDLVVILCAANAAVGTTMTSVSDNSSQPGAANTWNVIGPANGSSTLCLWLVWCVLTRSHVNGTVTTPTMSASCGRRTAGGRWYQSDVGGITFDTSATGSADSTSPITMVSGALANSGELVVACSAVRASSAVTATDSTGSGWSASPLSVAGAGVNPIVNVCQNWNLSAGTASTTDNHDYSAITTGCGIVASWYEMASAAVTPAAAGVSFDASGSITAPTQIAFTGTGISFDGTGSITPSPVATPDYSFPHSGKAVMFA